MKIVWFGLAIERVTEIADYLALATSATLSTSSLSQPDFI